MVDEHRERGTAEIILPDLDSEQRARLERWKVIYVVGAIFGIDCNRDAEQLANRLLFARWWAGKVER